MGCRARAGGKNVQLANVESSSMSPEVDQHALPGRSTRAALTPPIAQQCLHARRPGNRLGQPRSCTLPTNTGSEFADCCLLTSWHCTAESLPTRRTASPVVLRPRARGRDETNRAEKRLGGPPMACRSGRCAAVILRLVPRLFYPQQARYHGVECLVHGVCDDHSVQVCLADRAKLHQRVQVHHLSPEGRAPQQHDGHERLPRVPSPAHFAGLHQRGQLEQLVECAEAAWRGHDAAGSVGQHHLPRGEVVHPKRQPLVNEAIHAVLERQRHGDPHGARAALPCPAVCRLHQPWPAARCDNVLRARPAGAPLELPLSNATGKLSRVRVPLAHPLDGVEARKLVRVPALRRFGNAGLPVFPAHGPG
mmetsp:Transcript_16075/g.60818  ORF Transcript_16075/g.60818 Transcript_16075/m.60818 type:complete len:364 (-) Transcript_16075:181-1272(-)